MTDVSELEIRKAVKERYSKLAMTNEACCTVVGGDCCSSQVTTSDSSVPVEATSVGAGCGSPLELVGIREGTVLVDLGSGGGIDVFRSSRLVGAGGRAIGVDATPEMVWRARETKAKYGEMYGNAEFRLGEIEHLPIESESVDYIVSNCVINLSPDKPAVFGEAYRVLRPGGVFAVADVTLQCEIPELSRKDMDAWSACIGGALTDSEYERELLAAGFKDVRIAHVSDSNIGEYPFKYYSSHIIARKP